MRSLLLRTDLSWRMLALGLLVAMATIRMSPACATATAYVLTTTPMSACQEMPDMPGMAMPDTHRDDPAARLHAGGAGCLALQASAPAAPPPVSAPPAERRAAADPALHPRAAGAPPAPPPRRA